MAIRQATCFTHTLKPKYENPGIYLERGYPNKESNRKKKGEKVATVNSPFYSNVYTRNKWEKKQESTLYKKPTWIRTSKPEEFAQFYYVALKLYDLWL